MFLVVLILKLDLLVTSGLGGVYPSGYPVAIVTSVGFSDAQPFANIKARPVVDTNTMRYVLLYWYQSVDNENNDSMIMAKQRSDSKHILRQEKIKNLIESLSDSHLQIKKTIKRNNRNKL